MMAAVRTFFARAGFLEIETPLRIPAPAPEAHIDAQASGEWFLHTSPELCMKRLLASGYERIFQVCRCFRKAERGARHLPEMTLLEWYAVGWSYLDLMEQCEALIGFLAEQTEQGDYLIIYCAKLDATASPAAVKSTMEYVAKLTALMKSELEKSETEPQDASGTLNDWLKG